MLRQAEAADGRVVQQLHQPRERDDALFDKIGVEQGEGRLQPDDAHRALFKAAALLLGAVGRVVGCDHVDRPVGDALEQRFAVGPLAKRGIHLEPPVLLQVRLVEQQVVRPRLARHVQPLGLRLADEHDALLRGDVADVVAAARLAHELEVVLKINLQGKEIKNGKLIRLSAKNGLEENTIDNPTNIYPVENNVTTEKNGATVEIPASSLNIIRLK